ncbi:MAG: chorismate-binding protein [Candidatus Rokubacteria bacterium]|nr:chorismate-binding protein [Candidatus Rokubacteria bacterium]
MSHDFPSAYYGLIAGRDNVVFLETSRYDADNYRSFLFIDPIDTLQACSVDEVPGLLADIEKYLARNCYLAGYFGYECGYHFEKIAGSSAAPSPLAWFGVYPAPIVFNHLAGTFDAGHEALRAPARDDGVPGEYAIGDLRCDIPADEYFRTVDTIKGLIRSGCTYQINFTTKYVFEFHGSTMALYDALKKGQRVSYGAFIRADGRTVLSFSPELFFRRKDDTIITRNDVGRIAEIGSVKVRELFAVEKYQTLFQMTSTVEGRIRQGVTYRDIFQSLFPSGSVTGAPKIRSMQIIRELEDDWRGVYTGAIGYFSPANEAVFNVAIRTLVIDGGRGEMGVGGGIVCDSSPEEEYGECQLKAEFLTTRHEEFGLIETLLWDDGYRLLSRHIRRVSESAEYFDYPCDGDRLIKSLVARSKEFLSAKRYKVRLVLDRHGNATVESWVIDEREPDLARVALSGVRTDSKDRFLYHKTTRREVYDQLHRVAAGNGFADVIFMNEKSQVTEGAISNVFIRKGKDLITPLVQCGLLNGVYRQHLIETQPGVCEGVVSLDDLRNADAIYICNAIRGLRAVTLCEQYLGPGSDSDAARAGQVCEHWTRS